LLATQAFKPNLNSINLLPIVLSQNNQGFMRLYCNPPRDSYAQALIYTTRLYRNPAKGFLDPNKEHTLPAFTAIPAYTNPRITRPIQAWMPLDLST